jgi:predicted RNA methylase
VHEAASADGAPPLGYELLDAGEGRRLERFGGRIVDRPAPGASEPRRAPSRWREADLRFDAGHGWSFRIGAGPWLVFIGELTMELRATSSGGVGLYPEHAANLEWIAARIEERKTAGGPAAPAAGTATPTEGTLAAPPGTAAAAGTATPTEGTLAAPPGTAAAAGTATPAEGTLAAPPGTAAATEGTPAAAAEGTPAAPPGTAAAGTATAAAAHPVPTVLNLFAHTGLVTLAAARAGAAVVHVDAARASLAWARRNAALNGLHGCPIRWLLDDARAFVEREARRGARYDGIVLDPPSFGRAHRRRWRLRDDLPALLSACAAVAADDAFVLLTAHTSGLDGEALGAMVDASFPTPRGRSGVSRLELRAPSGATLALGWAVRVPGDAVRERSGGTGHHRRR